MYDTDKFNVIHHDGYELKEGRYPLKYNEIMANSNYKIGDEIILNSSKVITMEKTDIYVDSLNLIVVGIVEKTLFLNKDNFYVDYDLLENHLKMEMLKNSNKSLYEYFEQKVTNDYKSCKSYEIL